MCHQRRRPYVHVTTAVCLVMEQTHPSGATCRRQHPFVSCPSRGHCISREGRVDGPQHGVLIALGAVCRHC